MSMHQLLDHYNTHADIDQVAYATIGWSTSVRTPAFLSQLIYGWAPRDFVFDEKLTK